MAGVLMLTAVPAAGIAAGQVAENAAVQQVRAQATAAPAVPAVLLAPAPAAGTPDPYADIAVALVPARWVAPSGQARTGAVLAPTGSTVQTWVDESGHIVPAPLGRSQVIGDVFVAVTLAMLAAAFALVAAMTLIHRKLQHRRMNGWEAEWRTVAPLWTGYLA